MVLSERNRHEGLRCVLGVGVALFGGVVGCGGGGQLTARNWAAIGDVHLFGAPSALELDGQPGADGIGVRIYACAPGVARGITIQQGTLEILMFDGPLNDAARRTKAPLKNWQFLPNDLRHFAAETSLGIGYQLALRWEADQPRGKFVTVVARYRSPNGQAIYSASNSLAVETK